MHRLILVAALAAALGPASAQQRMAALGTCATEGGAPILGCEVGYRTFGRLNAARDNAVVVPMWYGGRSGDVVPYLAPMGVDTTRYFVVVTDPLLGGVSSSPSTSRAQPGDRFPTVTLSDMVETQRRLLREHLGVERLHGVVGYSLGGMQALAWASRHPAEVGRAVSLFGTSRADACLQYIARTFQTLLRAERAGGLSRPELDRALATFWRVVVSTPAREATLPPDSVEARIARAAAGWAEVDPVDNLRLWEAIADFDSEAGFGADPARAGAAYGVPMLLVVSPDDHIMRPEPLEALAQRTGAEVLPLRSPCGHHAFFCRIEDFGPRVAGFLAGVPARPEAPLWPRDQEHGP